MALIINQFCVNDLIQLNSKNDEGGYHKEDTVNCTEDDVLYIGELRRSPIPDPGQDFELSSGYPNLDCQSASPKNSAGKFKRNWRAWDLKLPSTNIP